MQDGNMFFSKHQECCELVMQTSPRTNRVVRHNSLVPNQDIPIPHKIWCDVDGHEGSWYNNDLWCWKWSWRRDCPWFSGGFSKGEYQLLKVWCSKSFCFLAYWPASTRPTKIANQFPNHCIVPLSKRFESKPTAMFCLTHPLPRHLDSGHLINLPFPHKIYEHLLYLLDDSN